MPQALVYVANAVPSGDGRMGLSRQNVGLRIEPSKVMVGGGGEATVVIRELVGVDSVEVQGSGLIASALYQILAIKLDVLRQVIADFRADAKGTGGITAQLKFFTAGYMWIAIAPAEGSPTASAGIANRQSLGRLYQLSAEGSLAGAGGGALIYQWRVVRGNATLTAPERAVTQIFFDEGPRDYTIELTVANSRGQSDSTRVEVSYPGGR